ncbi:hypothetical protein DXG01_005530 [Tephrocybe rancida]|nr:hypothetical protein DXG01_005530 [Tephrocybe rancida]
MSRHQSSTSVHSVSKYQNQGQDISESNGASSRTGQRNATVHNWWWSYKQLLRESVAEFAGTMLLTIFGLGVNCQAVLSSDRAVSASPKGDWASVSLGWGAGIALGVWVSGGISGGHINPAVGPSSLPAQSHHPDYNYQVTLAMATWRGFPWKKVPAYFFAQLMGGIVGAAIIYANYFHAIDIFEGGSGVRTLKTAGLFGTFAADYMTNVSAFFSEFFVTAILVLVILAVTDKGNSPAPAGLVPLALFITFVGITAALGINTSFGINPARDLGPRLLTSMVGYGKAVYTFRNHYWIWCPIIAPFLGAQFGAMFYDAFLYNGDDGRFNKS